MIITDRSRIESGYDCPRKRYWQYEYLNWGVVPKGAPPEDLAYGIGFHEGAEEISLDHGLEAALENLNHHVSLIEGVTLDGLPKSDEYRALGYGHLRTLHDQFLPRLKETYDIIGVETEIALPLSGDVLDLTRLDVALRDRKTGLIYYTEWKTDSDPSDIGWRMEFNLQFVLGVAALEKALGEVVTGTLIVGVDKGQKRGPSPTERKEGITGYRRESPFTYAYMKDSGWTKEWRLEWTKYWKKTPTWTQMTSEEWWSTLEQLSPGLAMEQFTISTPILWDRAAFESSRRQIVASERRISEGNTRLVDSGTTPKGDILEEYFPMNRKNCRNDGGYKKDCPMIDICHFRQGSDPLEWGFKWRDANHPLEETLRRRVDNGLSSS